MKLLKYCINIPASALFFIVFLSTAEAAIMYVAPLAKSVVIGNEFFLDIKINTDESSINAAQAVLHFSNNILTVTEVDKTGSTFNFWVEEPAISNENGTVSFIGGTPKGVSGDTLQILRIKFKASGSGSGNIVLSDATITASDGKGTNVLSKLESSKVTVGGAQEAIPVLPTVIAPKEQPKPVERPPVVAKKIPNQPRISVPFYPDSLKWYSHLGDVIAFWDVPDDVVAIATQLDRNPNAEPKNIDTELFTGKNFGPIEEGVWYVHAQFKNNVGWGPTAHYKIAIDRTAPVPFEIQFNNAVADNPTPEIIFATQDGRSGIEEILVFVDDKEPIRLKASIAQVLPPQLPGKHRVLVRVADKAGNSIEDDLEFEIIPIASPKITSINKEFFVGEGRLEISGTALSDISVLLSLKNKAGQIIKTAAVKSDNNGNWEIRLDDPLKKGQYTAEITAQDRRGALSLPVQSELIKVRVRPILTVAGIGITPAWFLTGLIAILTAGVMIGWLAYHFWLVRIRRKTIVAQRDIFAASNLIKKDIDKLLTKISGGPPDERTRSEMEFLLKQTKERVEKSQKYIVEGVEEIIK